MQVMWWMPSSRMFFAFRPVAGHASAGTSWVMAGEELISSALGTLRMAGAMGGDVVRAFDLLGVVPEARRPDDPLQTRDPDYIRDTLPSVRLMSDLYFRGEV